ncbi:endo-1,4-beta-xylanase [Flammeovirga yaeyamensis]|uniref:Beta-xylanase n=1 Tax=Flammeovirga yaeyamensis TaxID=367791 RepID=A0AAX1NAA8_9BACT|nr:endo-1,4-beta-xylanase [Flammeovirga yaeyamensis]MBB3701367.1 endo-1,4-beta-xylanase [Flammeovirga yaeyamensis]NMF38565.1 endo-1,4-beta-xylanase [Flammeovirga yaeyamensis]QWG04471.1 endo-1,4-beta-xylanase [Flammeovirga yaeyamensis]
MKTLSHVLLLTALLGLLSCQNQSSETSSKTSTLKEAFDGKFLLGTALHVDHTNGLRAASSSLVEKQYNSIVAENCMKPEEIHPSEGVYNFTEADQFVEYGEKHNMFIVGHTLVWHSQVPDWFFINAEGKECSREELIERMKDHIYTVVGRYKGRVDAWDVVNEAIDDKEGLRKSKWYNIIGEDFIDLAFQFAHEADPNAELYYNDYSMILPHRRAEAVRLVKRLLDKGIRVDGIGMQAHYGVDYVKIPEFEKSITDFADLGVKVMLTELDISVLPFPTEEISAEISQKYAKSPEFDPYPENLPDSMQVKLAQNYVDLFKVLIKHQDKISRVTFWGVNDAHTWRNNWPIEGRTDHPLLFDRNNQPKEAYHAVLELAKSNPKG